MIADATAKDGWQRSACWQPDFRQKIGGPQRRQYAGIDLVRLDVRMRNGLDLQRIGHDDTGHIWRQHADDGYGVAGRLNDDLVLFAQATAELSSPERIIVTRPAGRSRPSSQNTTSANLR